MAAVTGYPWRPAPVPDNNVELRLAAVRASLNRRIAGRPGLVVSTRCPVARKGFNSKYQYRRLKIAGGERYADTPDKTHPWSDIHDAIQYHMVGAGEHLEVLGRKARRADSAKPVMANSDFGVFG
jgi:hypothetical protein